MFYTSLKHTSVNINVLHLHLRLGKSLHGALHLRLALHLAFIHRETPNIADYVYTSGM